MKRARSCAAALLAAVSATIAAASAPAAACGYHGALGNAFSAQHPRSIGVAIALREGAEQGVLEEALVAPRLVDITAYQRTVQRVMRLLGVLERAAIDGAKPQAPGFSLLLVESGLWNRVSATSQGQSMEVHVDGPDAGETVVVTGAAVIAAMLDGRLGAIEALERGQLVFDGAQSRRVQTWFARAFPSQRASVSNQAPP